MNRIITILVTIFILLLLYIWISHVWGSENPRHSSEIIDARQNEMSEGLMADADTTLHQDDAIDITSSSQTPEGNETSQDEFDTDRKAQGSTMSDTESQPTESVKEEKPKEEPKPVVTKTPEQPKKETSKPAVSAPPKTTPAKPAATTSKPAAKPTATAVSSTNGKHLVIAGNFSQQVNAQQRVDELKRMGFKEAEVVNFDLSEYHTVCVGRYDDVNEARRMVKKLKDYHKIDAYVRIGS